MTTNRLMSLGRWFGLPRGVRVTKIMSSISEEVVNHTSRGGRYRAQFPFEESVLALDWEHIDPSQIITAYEQELS